MEEIEIEGKYRGRTINLAKKDKRLIQKGLIPRCLTGEKKGELAMKSCPRK